MTDVRFASPVHNLADFLRLAPGEYLTSTAFILFSQLLTENSLICSVFGNFCLSPPSLLKIGEGFDVCPGQQEYLYENEW